MKTPLLPTLLSVLAAFGLAIITSWMNITMKFGQHAHQAKLDTKTIFWRFVGGIANLYLFLFLARELLSSAPLTRESLTIIIIASLGLHNAFVMWWTGQIIQFISDLKLLK
jgi:hypothetical protein